jgi:hypothetical protein
MTELPIILFSLILLILAVLTVLLPVFVYLIWQATSSAADTLRKMEHMMRHGK